MIDWMIIKQFIFVICASITICHSSEKNTSEESIAALKDNSIPASLKKYLFDRNESFWGKFEKKRYKKRIKDIKKELKVLVYDTEGGKTTRSFIEALKQHLTDFQFQDFNKAIEEERNTLPTIAVVRHTSIRIKEHLKDIKLRRDQDNVKNQEEVIVIYFYVDGFEDGMLDTIQNISEEKQFAEIVLMDFSGKKLKTTGKWSPSPGNHQKSINDKALQNIKQKLKKEWCANVFIASNLPIVKRFVEELQQEISKPMQTIEQSEFGTIPTLIFTTGHQFDCLKGLKEKGAMKVFLVNITDFDTTAMVPVDVSDATENLSKVPVQQTISFDLSSDADKGNESVPLVENRNRSMPYQQYGNIWEVVYYKEEFLEGRYFFESVKSFGRTCPK